MNFDTVVESLSELKTNAAELHGLLTGWLCAGSNWSGDKIPPPLGDWLGGERLPDSSSNLVAALHDGIKTGLLDPEYGFQLLLPDDDTEIDFRRQQLSL